MWISEISHFGMENTNWEQNLTKSVSAGVR